MAPGANGCASCEQARQMVARGQGALRVRRILVSAVPNLMVLTEHLWAPPCITMHHHLVASARCLPLRSHGASGPDPRGAPVAAQGRRAHDRTCRRRMYHAV